MPEKELPRVELPEIDARLISPIIGFVLFCALWVVITFVCEGSCGLRGRFRLTTGNKRA